MVSLHDLKQIAEIEYSDLVRAAFFVDHKLRILLKDHSFVDVNLSMKLSGTFGYHWETLKAGGTFYRYDNFPDPQWRVVSTFPYHFHNGSQEQVESSPFPTDITDGFRASMDFVRMKIACTHLLVRKILPPRIS